MTMKDKICLSALLLTFLISYHAVSAKTVPPSTSTEVPEKQLMTIEKSKQEEIHQEGEKQLEKIDAKLLSQKNNQKTLEEISMKDTTTLPVPNTSFDSKSERSKRGGKHMAPCHFKLCNYG